MWTTLTKQSSSESTYLVKLEKENTIKFLLKILTDK